MKPSSFFQTLRPHLLFALGLLVLASIYFAPVWQGKELPLHDIRQSNAATQELRAFKAKTGDYPLWTNALFSGMPAYMIVFEYPHTYVGTAVSKISSILPRPVDVLFLELLGAYILLVVLGSSGWVAALGAVGYAMGSYNIINLGAGHISQISALAYAPGVLAGVVLTLRGRYWVGGALTALFVCLEFGANHVQITYYLFLAAGLYALFEAVHLVRAGRTKQLTLALAVLLGAGALGAASYSKRLLVLNQYAKETIRGKSELTAKTTAQAGQPAKASNGLDEEYAFQYSYGLPETLTLLIPNFYGGKSNGGLDTNSDFYKAMVSRGVDPAAAKQFAEQGAPLYRGDMPIVGGPAYAGAILLFLFVLGMLISENRLKWPTLAATLLLLMIAWGKNFMLFNGLLFNYLPYFNKFRAVTMSLILIQLFVVVGAVLGLQALVAQKLTWKTIQRPFLISLGATAGLSALVALLGGSLFSFRLATDTDMMAQYFGPGGAASEMVQALVNDRIAVMRSDAFRSLFFILLAAGAIWLFVSNRLKPVLFYPLLLALVIVDLMQVDKRFLNNSDFVSKTAIDTAFEPTAADQQILQDKTLSYRVFSQNPGFMNDNGVSYFHKSVGGYHAAKLGRYQELITYAFPKNTLNVLNMLNTKYVIMPAQQPTQPGAQPAGPMVQVNPEALGNAWFVKAVQQVNDADAEIARMQTVNPRDTALVDKRFAAQLNSLPATLDPAGSRIELTAYIPDKLTYRSQTPTPQLAVFSEVYYRGESDWNAYLDGKKVPHMRADYILRALVVPAGTHTIEFRFEPPLVATGDTLDLIANLLLIAFLVGAVVMESRMRKTDEVAASPSGPNGVLAKPDRKR